MGSWGNFIDYGVEGADIPLFRGHGGLSKLLFEKLGSLELRKPSDCFLCLFKGSIMSLQVLRRSSHPLSFLEQAVFFPHVSDQLFSIDRL